MNNNNNTINNRNDQNNSNNNTNSTSSNITTNRTHCPSFVALRGFADSIGSFRCQSKNFKS